MSDTPAPVEKAVPSLSSRVVKLAKKIQTERNGYLATKGLLPGHDDFLLALSAADGVTMGILAETLDISPSSTTKIAMKLEGSGYLRREPSRIDSRQNHAFLTDEGQALVSEILSAYNAMDEELLKGIKSKDTERAFKFFDRIESDPSSAGKKPKKAGKKKSPEKTDKKSEKKVKKKKS